jgi:hypothetical protein
VLFKIYFAAQLYLFVDRALHFVFLFDRGQGEGQNLVLPRAQ